MRVSGRPRILMVTGAYFPETSGGGLQARGVARALRDRAYFEVLTTSTNPALPTHATEDGVTIHRIYVDVQRPLSELLAAIRMASAFIRVAPSIDIVNLHGFSRKAVLLLALARMFGKRFVLTLQTGGHDELAAARAGGSLTAWAFSHADLYLSVSPGLSRAYLDAGLPPNRLRSVCNAVDVDRFTPASEREREELRRALKLPAAIPVVLFVGYFSRDKRPDLLYRAWARNAAAQRSALVFVGATRRTYREVDPELATAIRHDAESAGFANRLFFVESTQEIEKYYRAANAYALPSIREGLPIALLEAMACGLPCVVSRLPGATDAVVDDGVSGILVEPDDEPAFAQALTRVLGDAAAARRIGEAARRRIVDRYAIERTAPAWLSAYSDVLA